MNPRISSIYRDILVKEFIPTQYFYQRIKGKVTGIHEFNLRKPCGTNYLMHHNVKDQLVVDLDGKYFEPGSVVITLCRIKPTKSQILKSTVEWCIKYIRSRVTSWFGI